jgi:hypothetical protein
MINKIRVLYDRDKPVARLVCRTKEDAVTPLDLKHVSGARFPKFPSLILQRQSVLSRVPPNIYS